MAGPAASILLRNPIDLDKKAQIRTYISDRSEVVDGDDFWIDGRPFVVIFGEEYHGELDEYREQLQDVLPWKPTDIFSLIAMCNQPRDHRLLGELCLHFCGQLDGLIDFGGDTGISPTGNRKFRGLLLRVPYDTAAGHQAFCQCGDAAFLEWYLTQPDFKMVK